MQDMGKRKKKTMGVCGCPLVRKISEFSSVYVTSNVKNGLFFHATWKSEKHKDRSIYRVLDSKTNSADRITSN